jgi:hypothetical protein
VGEPGRLSGDRDERKAGPVLTPSLAVGSERPA